MNRTNEDIDKELEKVSNKNYTNYLFWPYYALALILWFFVFNMPKNILNDDDFLQMNYYFTIYSIIIILYVVIAARVFYNIYQRKIIVYSRLSYEDEDELMYFEEEIKDAKMNFLKNLILSIVLVPNYFLLTDMISLKTGFAPSIFLLTIYDIFSYFRSIINHFY